MNLKDEHQTILPCSTKPLFSTEDMESASVVPNGKTYGKLMEAAAKADWGFRV